MCTLVDGTNDTTPATPAQLDTWIATAQAPYTTTLDRTTPAFEEYFMDRRETYLIVELGTMTIVDIVHFDANAALAALQQRLQAGLDR